METEWKQQIETLREILVNSERLVFLGGAGVSTESGIPDYRSASGLYNQDSGEFYSGATILSHSFFMKHPDIFYRYYKGKLIHKEAKPNRAHEVLANLEADNHVSLIITQNIDGLHELAGSKLVYDIHGNMYRNYCIDCNKEYELDYIINTEKEVPRCNVCGGIIRPDVVLYEEGLDSELLQDAIRKISLADTMLVGGTSLEVNPARGLVQYFTGKNLVFINLEATGMDQWATMIIRGKIGEVLDATGL
ncbi:NAD-dependent protein deacylase [Clostridia bacterium]|nr:NAD-dependent protein deacylase [Clostridia bacterium]